MILLASILNLAALLKGRGWGFLVFVFGLLVFGGGVGYCGGGEGFCSVYEFTG